MINFNTPPTLSYRDAGRQQFCQFQAWVTGNGKKLIDVYRLANVNRDVAKQSLHGVLSPLTCEKTNKALLIACQQILDSE